MLGQRRKALSKAGAKLTDIVSMRQWLTSADDVSAYQAVSREIVHHQPAAMLSVIDGLVWPSLRVEVEVTKGIVSTPAMFSAAITHCAEATWAS